MPGFIVDSANHLSTRGVSAVPARSQAVDGQRFIRSGRVEQEEGAQASDALVQRHQQGPGRSVRVQHRGADRPRALRRRGASAPAAAAVASERLSRLYQAGRGLHRDPAVRGGGRRLRSRRRRLRRRRLLRQGAGAPCQGDQAATARRGAQKARAGPRAGDAARAQPGDRHPGGPAARRADPAPGEHHGDPALQREGRRGAQGRPDPPALLDRHRIGRGGHRGGDGAAELRVGRPDRRRGAVRAPAGGGDLPRRGELDPAAPRPPGAGEGAGR